MIDTITDLIAALFEDQRLADRLAHPRRARRRTQQKQKAATAGKAAAAAAGAGGALLFALNRRGKTS
jgi:hypothetical protein